MELVGAVFLSYARADAEGDPYFETFYRDFAAQVRLELGAAEVKGLVFRDGDDIELGQRWQNEISGALRTHPTFLALVSPTYLNRVACQKEWAAFERRMRQPGGPTDVLLPIMWWPVSEASLPAAVTERQYKNHALGKTYATEGLRTVVNRGGQEYYDFLVVLVRRVKALVERNSLGATDEPFRPEELVNPFADVTAALAATNRPLGGPHHVQFIIVAPRPDELPDPHRSRPGYGDEPRDWCPYLPDDDATIALLLQGVALRLRMSSDPLSETADVVRCLQRAQAKNSIAVVVVDVWSLQLQVYRDVMRALDQRRFANAAVIVIWNNDGETTACRDALIDARVQAFPNLTMEQAGPPTFLPEINSPASLRDALADTLKRIRGRISMVTGTPQRKAQGGGPTTPPTVQGHGPRE